MTSQTKTNLTNSARSTSAANLLLQLEVQSAEFIARETAKRMARLSGAIRMGQAIRVDPEAL